MLISTFMGLFASLGIVLLVLYSRKTGVRKNSEFKRDERNEKRALRKRMNDSKD